MAKKASTAVAKRAAAPAVLDEHSVPAYLQNFTGPTGKEHLESEDLSIPRLLIAQSLSDPVKEGEMQEGSLYLNLGNQALWTPNSDEPLLAVVLAMGKNYVLWNPRDQGGGVLARANPVMTKSGRRYAWDKPNATFDTKVADGKIKVKWKTKTYVDQDGLNKWGTEIPGDKDSGPAATVHYNYIVTLPQHDDLICAISMSRSGVKKAKDWNQLIKQARGALCAAKWRIDTVDESNQSNQDYKNWRVRGAGYVDEATFHKLKPLMDSFATGFSLAPEASDQGGGSTEGGDDDDME